MPPTTPPSISRPRSRSRKPRRGCSRWPRRASTARASSTFNNALDSAIEMANNAYQREGGLSGIATALARSRRQDGRPAALRPDHPCRPPVDGQDGARHQHRLQRRTQPRAFASGARRSCAEDQGHDGAVVGFFSLEMSAEQLATRILSEQAGIPSEKIRRGMIDESEFKRLVEASRKCPPFPSSSTRPAASPLPSWRHGPASSSANRALA